MTLYKSESTFQMNQLDIAKFRPTSRIIISSIVFAQLPTLFTVILKALAVIKVVSLHAHVRTEVLSIEWANPGRPH